MTMVWWDVIQAEAMICQSTPDLIPQDPFAFLWEPDDDKKGHAAIFEVKFRSRSKKAITQLPQARERTAEQLFDQLESVALAVEGNDDPSEPPARCINDTKKTQLVTRSGLPRLRCCVCHIPKTSVQ